MGLLDKLFGQSGARPPSRKGGEMVSLVVLSNTHVELTLDGLRARLDEPYPGQFLPPRDQGNFVIDGAVPGAEFLIQSNLPGAAGMFLLHSVPGPYVEVSDFALYITEPSLRRIAETQACWLSVDCVRQYTGEEDAYRFIGSALAKLAPRDTTALVHPSRPITIAAGSVT